MNNNEKQDIQPKSEKAKRHTLSLTERVLFALVLVLFGAIVLINTINTGDFNPTVEYISHNSDENVLTENKTNSTSSLSEGSTESTSTSSSEETQSEAAATTSVASTTTVVSNSQAIIVNVNTASIEQLTQLNGIGEIKAKAIIDYRTANGNFETVDELLYVSGIGEKILEKIRGNITVK